MSIFDGMTEADIAALVREATDAKKRLKDAANTQRADLLRDFVTREVEAAEGRFDKSHASDWVGLGVNGLTVMVGDLEIGVSITLTAVQAKAARTEAFKAAKAKADVDKLTGDARKEFIAKALKEHDEVLTLLADDDTDVDAEIAADAAAEA